MIRKIELGFKGIKRINNTSYWIFKDKLFKFINHPLTPPVFFESIPIYWNINPFSIR